MWVNSASSELVEPGDEGVNLGAQNLAAVQVGHAVSFVRGFRAEDFFEQIVKLQLRPQQSRKSDHIAAGFESSGDRTSAEVIEGGDTA